MNTLEPTVRLYWEDDHCFEADAVVAAIRENAIAFDRTCFYPGGGGQPHDIGTVSIAGGDPADVVSVHVGDNEIIWHAVSAPPQAGMMNQAARLKVNRERRLALMRYHTVLHILNTVTLRDYGGWITGVQIQTDYSRIDFNLEGFSSAMRTELESKVNAVIDAGHALTSYFLPEAEFQKRPDLLRTLEARPPVHHGQVRVVEIEGFDAQACGGTHMATTAEVGRFSIFKTENKGRINKRLYIRLG